MKLNISLDDKVRVIKFYDSGNDHFLYSDCLLSQNLADMKNKLSSFSVVYILNQKNSTRDGPVLAITIIQKNSANICFSRS